MFNVSVPTVNLPHITVATPSFRGVLENDEHSRSTMQTSSLSGSTNHFHKHNHPHDGSETPAALVVSSGAPYYVKAVDSGKVWANNGTGLTLTYKFWDSLPAHYSASSTEARNFQVFSAAQKAATVKILDMLSSIINVTFVEVSSDSQAKLGFAQANLGSGVGAWAYYPGTTAKSGDVWTNNAIASTKTVTEGSYGFMVLAHEIGHAMGLIHPFESSPKLPSGEDSSRYTIMSYTWPFYAESYMLYDIATLQAKYGANMNHALGNDNYVLKSGAAYTIWDAGGTDTLDGSALTAGMTLNLNAGELSSVGKTMNIGIAYGVTIENAKGGNGADIIYGNAANNQIWGNGGNDKIYGSAGNDMIDGGAGTDTVIYSYNIGEFLIKMINSVTVTLSHLLLGMDTVTNVEKFTFGSLTYNFSDLHKYADNGGGTDPTPPTDPKPDPKPDPQPEPGTDQILNGTSKSETITGGSGNDTIRGNGGTDKLYGGAGSDTIHGGSKADKIYGEDGNDTLYGYGGADTIEGGNGNDTLYGGDGADKLYGNAGNDILYGEAGNDKLYGGAGDDILYGGDGSDYLYGEAGNDILYAGSGTDRLYGGDGNDKLIGGPGNDTLYGDAGNDILIGGEGKDIFYGGAGSDMFVFNKLDKTLDYVKDFTLNGTSADKLNITDILSGFNGNKDINDFVIFKAIGSTKMDMMINHDGVGNDWIKAATFTGSNFKGVTADGLLDSGQLIVNESVI